MVDFLGFMFFSMLEGFAVFALTFYIYRIDLKRYFWPSLVMINLIDLQNYIIREDFRLNWAAPISNLIIMIFFIALYVKIPIVWAAIMSLTGYIAFGIIQTAFFFFAPEYFEISRTHEIGWKMYVGQASSGLIGITVALLLFKLGYGFTFEFEKLRFRWEKILIIALITSFIISLGIMIIYSDFFINLLVLGIALFLFLIYSLQKDAEER